MLRVCIAIVLLVLFAAGDTQGTELVGPALGCTPGITAHDRSVEPLCTNLACEESGPLCILDVAYKGHCTTDEDGEVIERWVVTAELKNAALTDHLHVWLECETPNGSVTVAGCYAYGDQGNCRDSGTAVEGEAYCYLSRLDDAGTPPASEWIENWDCFDPPAVDGLLP